MNENDIEISHIQVISDSINREWKGSKILDVFILNDNFIATNDESVLKLRSKMGSGEKYPIIITNKPIKPDWELRRMVMKKYFILALMILSIPLSFVINKRIEMIDIS